MTLGALLAAAILGSSAVLGQQTPQSSFGEVYNQARDSALETGASEWPARTVVRFGSEAPDLQVAFPTGMTGSCALLLWFTQRGRPDILDQVDSLYGKLPIQDLLHKIDVKRTRETIDCQSPLATLLRQGRDLQLIPREHLPTDQAPKNVIWLDRSEFLLRFDGGGFSMHLSAMDAGDSTLVRWLRSVEASLRQYVSTIESNTPTR